MENVCEILENNSQETTTFELKKMLNNSIVRISKKLAM